MLISIIVPTFNVEKYIEKCINSLLNQDIKDYEIIVVDDCSTDQTVQVVKKVAKSRVKIIEKEFNSGLSDTRNIGIKAANGKYVMFVDSDDWIENNCLGKIVNFICNNKNIDVLYLGHILEKQGNKIASHGYLSPTNCVYSAHEFLISELSQRSPLPVPACFGVYRRNFIVENNLFFYSGVLHEDELWTPMILLQADTVGTLDLNFYHYIIRDDSISQKRSAKNGLDMIHSCKILEKRVSELEDIKLRRLMDNHIAKLYMKAMCRGKLYRRQYAKDLERFFPFKKAYHRKEKIKSIIFAVNYRMYYILDMFAGNNI